MSDSDSKPDSPSEPDWQSAQSEEPAAEAFVPDPEPSSYSAEEAQTNDTATDDGSTEDHVSTPASEAVEEEDDKLSVARRFLENETVRDAPHDQKVAFLRSKDVADDDIQTLLGDEPAPSASELREIPITQPPSQSTSTQTSSSSSSPPPPPPQQHQQQQHQQQQQPSSTTPSPDRAPIVTYPEFLTKPTRPPPLVTSARLLNALYAVVGLSTLVYGTGKSVVQPMVHAQTTAREDLHAGVARDLDALVAKLEKTVSVVPPRKQPQSQQQQAQGQLDAEAAESEAGDPAELFHRDMGTQTSFPLAAAATTTTNPADSKSEATTKRHAEQLAGLTKSLSSIQDGVRSQSEGLEGVKKSMQALGIDLDYYRLESRTASPYEVYGQSQKEPKDEIRQLKENVRRIKGVLLSTRTFPARTAGTAGTAR